jgi:hypothetical protein
MEFKLDNNIYRPIPPLLRGGNGVCNQGVTISKVPPPHPPLDRAFNYTHLFRWLFIELKIVKPYFINTKPQ